MSSISDTQNAQGTFYCQSSKNLIIVEKKPIKMLLQSVFKYALVSFSLIMANQFRKLEAFQLIKNNYCFNLQKSQHLINYRKVNIWSSV